MEEDISPEVFDKLLEMCRLMMTRSHTYSNFPVGSALLCTDGTIIGGCNVENCAYPLSHCAERTAVVKAVSEGKTKFRAVVIMGMTQPSPCGACRQVLAEFGLDLDVYVCNPSGESKKFSLRELIPHAFVPNELITYQNNMKNKANL